VRVLVIGASAAGLLSALLLARAGHDVLVVERDDLTPAADPEAAAAAAFRASAPQIVLPHVLLAAFREVVRERLPDVYAALLDAGVAEVPLSAQMPSTLTDRTPQPGDERLTVLMTRRATLDWVLARAAAAQPRVEVRHRSPVTALVAEPGAPPRVRGVRTPAGAVHADLVIDASGRRCALDRWLAAAGARGRQVESAECGLAYYGRQYRARPADLPGPVTTRVVAGLREFLVGIWGGDNDTMQIAIAPLAVDRRFTAARHPAVFDAVIRSVPFYAAWLDGLDPITGVAVMGGLHNTLRRLVADGAPVITGLHAVGDAVCTTNPTFARGLGMAAWTATGMADALATHPDDPHAQAVALDETISRRIAPWYADQAVGDAAALAVLRHTVLGAPAPQLGGAPDRITIGELRWAASVDPAAFRAVCRIMAMLGRPEDVYSDPDLVTRVRRVLADGPPPRMAQPGPAELRAALATG